MDLGLQDSSSIEQTSVVAAKLMVPTLNRPIVQRNRLKDRLKADMHRKLIYLSAPAGYGKTTLLADWQMSIAKVGWRSVGLSLESNDNEPTRFWLCFIEALRTLDSSWNLEIPCSDVDALSLSWYDDIMRLVAEIAHYPHQFFFILDNFQHLTNSSILESFSYLVAHSPKNMHFAIASQSPHFPLLSALRVENDLCEILKDDLAFSAEESSVFLRSIMDISIEEGDMRKLVRMTEGWPAGLQLVGLALLNGSSKGFLTSALQESNEYVFSYFADYVYSKQSEDLQNFLLVSSVIGEFCADCCDYVMGTDGGVESIRALVNANLFILSIDGKPGWYRYQGLFRDFLRSQTRMLSVDKERVIHIRAYEWLSNAGQTEMAVVHALHAKCDEAAVDLIWDSFFITADQFDFQTIRGWLFSIASDYTKTQPLLPLLRAIVDISTGCLGSAERYLIMAKSFIAKGDSEEVLVTPSASLKNFYEAVLGMYECNTVHFEQGLNRLHELLKSDLIPTELRGICINSMAVASIAQSNIDDAHEFLTTAAQYAYERGITKAYLSTACQLAQLDVERGDLQQAYEGFERVYRRALRLQDCDDILLSAGTGAWSVAKQLDLPGYDDASISDNVFFSKNSSSQPWMYIEQTGSRLVEYHLAHENTEKAEKVNQIVSERLGNSRFCPVFRTNSCVNQLRISVAASNRNEIDAWVYEQKKRYRAHELESPAELVALGLCMGKDGQFDEALLLVDEACGLLYGRQQYTNALIFSLVAKSRLLARKGLGDESFEAMVDALKLGQQHGYVDIFASEGDYARRHYRSIQAGENLNRDDILSEENCYTLHREYIERICSVCETRLNAKFHPIEKDTAPSVVAPYFEPLTEREIEVLHYIADGMGSQEISKDLFISPTTAKTHIRNIYRKLGAHSQKDAVQLAYSYGVLK